MGNLYGKISKTICEEISDMRQENAALKADNALMLKYSEEIFTNQKTFAEQTLKRAEKAEAECERLQPVVDAAINWTHDFDGDCKLSNAIATYLALTQKDG